MEESQSTSTDTLRVLAALSDEKRFRIVELLAGEDTEMTCGAIGSALDLSPSLLSHHLSILAEAGIIGRRKNGLWTMNMLQRPVIAREVEKLKLLLGSAGAEGGSDDGGADAGLAGWDAGAPDVVVEPGAVPPSAETDGGAAAGS